MPVYNVEQYLSAAINSVLNQTFSDFELILVDDGSTDSSGQIANQYSKTDARIHLIHQPNGGLSAARNKGLKHANGNYVYFIDSDDLIDVTTLQQIHESLIEYQFPEIVAFNATPFIDATDKSSKEEEALQSYENYFARNYLLEKPYLGVEFYQEMSGKGNFVAPVWLYVTKMCLIKELDLKFVTGILHEDEVFSRYLFIKANQIYFTNKKLYYHRLRKGSIMQSEISNHKIVSYITVAETINDLYEKTAPDLSELKEDIWFFYDRAVILYEMHFPLDQVISNRLIFSKLFIHSNHVKRLLKLRFPRLYRLYKRLKLFLSFRKSI